VADDRATEASDSPPPKKLSGDADTMPAAERDQRPTIPDIAPPYDTRYRLGIELGRGGMGRVVEAFDTQLGRTVALKEVLPRGGASVERRFQREVQITARLEHASIVPLYDAGTMPDGRPFYVMRRVTGRPLDELITRAKDLPERMALLSNLLAAMDAVAHAHRRGIIHRDLKPANILVGELGETVVIDWGLAKVVGEEDEAPGEPVKIPQAADSLQTQVGSVFGTPGFMPPEQARGEELGPRGDVFALGASLYQLLVGRPPIAGKSATDAIASSIQRRIVPIAVAAPGAPPELVAIVEKALAFEAEDRYPNAGFLAEDVRRFTTGQVVAAHRYTRRERIARFAKRHRAPLSVAALATVAVAILAWVGVHRILVERDLANAALAEADAQRKAAEASNRALLDRTDSLLVTKARALVDTNPTEALALLKELRPTSSRMGEARAIAQAAVTRGVAWGLRAEGSPQFVELDPSATLLAETTRDGALHVWDLDSHRVLFERGYARNVRPLWVAGGRLVMMRQDEPPDLLDPKTGAAERLAVPALQIGYATAKGDRVAALDATHHAGMLDLAARTWRPMWPDHVVTSFAYASDGSWLALADKAGMVVLDANGAELARRDGKLLIESSLGKRVVVFDTTMAMKAFELVLDPPAPVWRDLAVALPPQNVLLAAYYRGNELDVVTTVGITAYRDGKAGRTVKLEDFSAFMIPSAGNNVSITPGNDGNLHFTADAAHGKIALPIPASTAHLAGVPGKTRFVVATTGIALVYDLAEIVPISVPKLGMFQAEFVDPNTLLMWPGEADSYRWHDIATGVETPLDHEPRMPSFTVGVDAPSGRLLVREMVPGNAFELSLFTKGQKHVRMVAHGPRLLGRLVPDGVLFAQNADPRVMVSLHDEAPHELAKVDGGVQALMPLEPRHFAALGRSGELVRGALAGGALERVHVDTGADAFLGVDRNGRVLIASGTRLLVWDGDVHELLKTGHPIVSLQATAGGVLIVLDDNSIQYAELSASAPPVVHDVVASAGTQPTISGDGTWVASAGNGGQVTIVEIPSLARWTLPVHYAAFGGMLNASPAKRMLMQGTGTELELRELPLPASDLTAWIDDKTNAFESTDNVLTWPWQRP
jgi:hypothetical protein